MRLLITGGAGFIGSNFIHHIIKVREDIEVINFDKLTYAGNLNNLESLKVNTRYTFIKGDIAEPKDVEDVFNKYEIDGVINFAAESHVDRSILGPLEFVRTNIMGTATLLDVARKYFGDDAEKRFHHISTDEVFGALGDSGSFKESTPYDPSSPYSASKAGSDHLVRAYGRTFDMNVVITNCSNNYGPYQFPEKLIPLVIKRIVDEKEIPVYGKGENVRDWLYVEDHCKAIEKVFFKGKNGQTYNVGGNSEKKNIDIVNLLCDLVDKRLSRDISSRKLITFVKDRPGHDFRYAIDNSKIKKELGWEPEVNFDEGMKKTVEWYLENGKWVDDIISGDYRKFFSKQYKERLKSDRS
ncbi:MAG: dTDP-glucose 4,6-dehydratase [Candidatus Muiribacterium halophilum]|uniref:dTDP-glucose 4,6-dehydratase n=1 Tax=Muiribacterium halophilum TaxID=2053465 RepID=A0A2N5ZHE9_MUIH1|nr:MAG: dTDP-glucose 4,6-dehydratase [Candidatus Muirbacterium halophilum]